MNFSWSFFKAFSNGTEEQIEDNRWVNLTSTGKKIDNLVLKPNVFLGEQYYDVVYKLKVKIWLAPIIDENNYGKVVCNYD